MKQEIVHFHYVQCGNYNDMHIYIHVLLANVDGAHFAFA